MKSKFSTSWKSSKQPRKQRKYLANAPLHLKRKFLSVNLSKELRAKHGKRNIPVVKGDVVIVMRGKFKKKKGKVTEVKTKMMKIYIEGIQVKKQEGSKVNVPLRASNLQIVELNLDDRKRMAKLGGHRSVYPKTQNEGAKKVEVKKEIPKKKVQTKKVKEEKK
ncbi:50S ribosomal protein L24 [Candidatus Pacearchaeota archaeon]|nr:50S ribosomal protein L24 [Candidatus Pacearchaeota archaeon]